MIGIILINYNSEIELIDYISNELSLTKLENKIVVVDNSYSKDKHTQLQYRLGQIKDRTFNKDLFLITKKENLGYARANNLGVRFLNRSFKIDYFLFSNTDIELKSKFVIASLIKKLKGLPDVAAIGPRVIGSDGIDQSPKEEISFLRYFGWQVFPFLKGKSPLLKKKTLQRQSEKLKERYCYQLSGCFMLVNNEDFVKAGMFDEHTFLYGEEKILAERLLSIQKKMFFYPKQVILHQESSIIGKNQSSNQIQKLLHHNNCYYYQTYKRAPKILVKILKLK